MSVSKTGSLNPEFLSEYERETSWTRAQGITYRTNKRYRDKGMPFLMWGGCVYIPKEEARQWIAGRIQRRNPPRRRRQAASTAEISAS